MQAVAVRRQLLVALVAVGAVLITNLIAGSVDREVVVACFLLTILCLAPAAFSWSLRAYRIAAATLAFLVTVAAGLATVDGAPWLLPAAIVAWLTLLPTRRRAPEL